MAIDTDQYVAEVRASLPEAHMLLSRVAVDHEGVGMVWQLNSDLTHLLLWSWRSGDRDTCQRVLAVMEKGLIDTDENDHAPVFNSLGIGVVETIHQRLAHEDFVAFVETWPPAMREQALAYKTPWGDDFLEDGADTFRIPFGLRLRWTLRHPIRTRFGTRIGFAR